MGGVKNISLLFFGAIFFLSIENSVAGNGPHSEQSGEPSSPTVLSNASEESFIASSVIKFAFGNYLPTEDKRVEQLKNDLRAFANCTRENNRHSPAIEAWENAVDGFGSADGLVAYCIAISKIPQECLHPVVIDLALRLRNRFVDLDAGGVTPFVDHGIGANARTYIAIETRRAKPPLTILGHSDVFYISTSQINSEEQRRYSRYKSAKDFENSCLSHPRYVKSSEKPLVLEKFPTDAMVEEQMTKIRMIKKEYGALLGTPLEEGFESFREKKRNRILMERRRELESFQMGLELAQKELSHLETIRAKHSENLVEHVASEEEIEILKAELAREIELHRDFGKINPVNAEGKETKKYLIIESEKRVEAVRVRLKKAIESRENK